MWQLKIFIVFVLGLFINGVAGIEKLKPFLRIVGGQEVDITDYPHQVSVILYGELQCGGSIISDKYVLTAAHCFYDSNKLQYSVDYYNVRAGSSSWAKGGVLYDVESIIPHPKFIRHKNEYDIGVIRISGIFKLDGVTTKIVKLADASHKLAIGDPVTVTGWGKLGNKRRKATKLQAAFLPVVDNHHCINAYKNLRDYMSDKIVCVGFPVPFQGTCGADSGGPLVDEHMIQHGVLFAGHENCTNTDSPNLFARVASLRSWIKENTGV